MDAAAWRVSGKHPELVKNGAIVGWPTDGEAKATKYQTYLAGELIWFGLCAWPQGKGDEVQVLSEDAQSSQGYHMIGFSQGLIGTAANAYRGDSAIVGGSPGVPPPSPPPTIAPPLTVPPGPSPSPAPGGCAVSVSDVQSWRVIVKPHGGQQFDVSAVACGPKVVAANLNCGVNCCELSEEKGNHACELALYGASVYTAPSTVRLVQVYPDNANIQKVADGSGQIKVCGSVDPRSCVKVNVKAGVPPCDVQPGSNQACVIR